jgi:D-arginine dehydrogenase
MTGAWDVIVLGAGIAGASVAAELDPGSRVALLEVEDQPGRHATGRSAAMYFESYGNATVRGLTRASRRFFEHPPAGFCQAPLLSPRNALFVADAPRLAALESIANLPAAVDSMHRLDAASCLEHCPILRRDWVAGGVLDDSGRDMDVAAIHQGYLRIARNAGTRVVLRAGNMSIARRDGRWHVTSSAGDFSAPVLVNAAGAWGDVVARMAGVPPIGLMPLRRTCVTLPAPAGHDIRRWPMVIDADDEFYFKPEAGHLLLSPANEDPSEPCDAVPEELDVAIAVDRFETATGLAVPRLHHRWAGLRSFVADRSPVAGFATGFDGFFWLVGQGGYGIQMAPGLARAAAALIAGRALPEDIREQGVDERALSPTRPGLAPGPQGAAQASVMFR